MGQPSHHFGSPPASAATLCMEWITRWKRTALIRRTLGLLGGVGGVVGVVATSWLTWDISCTAVSICSISAW